MEYKFMRRKSDWNYTRIFFLVVLPVALFALFLAKGPGVEYASNPPSDYRPIQLVGVTDTSMVLGDNCNQLEIPITRDQLISIRTAFSGGYIRPLAHDIYKSTIDHYGIKPLYFTMDRFEGNLWYATLRMQKEYDVLDMEVRPSDGVAISVRYELPMYMKKSTFEEQMTYVC